MRSTPAMMALTFALGCASSAPSAVDGGVTDDVRADAPAPRDVDERPDAPPLAERRAIVGRAVVAWVRVSDAEAWWIEERLAAIPWRAGDREVGPRRIVRARGDSAPEVVYEPAADERLIAATGHPSGHWSAVVTTADLGVALVRGDGAGGPRARVVLDDPGLAADRAAWIGEAPPARLVLSGRGEDSVRVAADGEDVVVTLTTAWDATLAYRWRWRDGSWARGPRTLVAPASPLPVYIPDTASYDVFDAVVNPWSTQLCVDPDGAAHVALWVDRNRVNALNRAFGSSYALLREGPPTGDPLSDVLVTRIDRDGARTSGRVVGTPNVDDEPFAIACARGRVVVAGRHRREPGRDNTEIHGFAALIEGDGSARALSFDGDALALLQAAAFDEGGEVLLGGTEGWTQNPVGVSVGGPGRPLLLRWSGVAGAPPRRVALDAVRGHGELRAIALSGARVWLGGVEDGPVTHTFDGDRAALRGDGWIRGLR